jgi:hypothetical protein
MWAKGRDKTGRSDHRTNEYLHERLSQGIFDK